MSFKTRYDEYMNSARWQELRKLALAYAGRKCQLCNSAKKLHVHHRKYPKVLGSEPVNDLTVLCKKCHFAFHDSYGLCNKDDKEKTKPNAKMTKEQKHSKKKVDKRTKRSRKLKSLSDNRSRNVTWLEFS